MSFSEANLKRMAFYEQHYQIVVDLPLVYKVTIRICDYEIDSERKCRFCGKSKPEVSFRKKAHAIPEFLGNKSLILMNECDICNEFFSIEYEDHLAKWFGPMPSLCQMQGKKGTPKYKSDKFISSKGNKGMELFVNSNSSIIMNIKEGSSGTLKIPVEMKTEPYIPIRAAQAFIKSAISVLPEELLSECENTKLWLLGKASLNIGKFPVLYAFTPGINPYRFGRVMICKRKNPSEEMPFLWFIIETTNFLFQIMIPFCKSDGWIKYEEDNNLEATKFPTPFSEEYERKFGKTVWYFEDWACDRPIRQNREASFHIDKVVEKKLGNVINDRYV
ncbi:MAG: HNH endonuclease [Phycisphaerae bacterium]